MLAAQQAAEAFNRFAHRLSPYLRLQLQRSLSVRDRPQIVISQLHCFQRLPAARSCRASDASLWTSTNTRLCASCLNRLSNLAAVPRAPQTDLPPIEQRATACEPYLPRGAARSCVQTRCRTAARCRHPDPLSNMVVSVVPLKCAMSRRSRATGTNSNPRWSPRQRFQLRRCRAPRSERARCYQQRIRSPAAFMRSVGNEFASIAKASACHAFCCLRRVVGI